MSKELSPMQRTFCEYYAQCGNATQAALSAGYSRKTAYSQGSRLLKNAEIKRYIQQLQIERSNGRIADNVETMTIVSDILRNAKAPSAKLKAAQLLFQTGGAFLQNEEPLPTKEQENRCIIVLPWQNDNPNQPFNAVKLPSWRKDEKGLGFIMDDGSIVVPLVGSEDDGLLLYIDPYSRDAMAEAFEWDKEV